MQDSPEVFGHFFAPLVGDESRVDDLREKLTAKVNTYTGDFHSTDPYARLQTEVMDQMNWAVRAIPVSGLEAREYRHRIRLNGKTAMKQTVVVVRTIGDIYTARATAPQHISRVTQNANKALLHLYAIASLDGLSASTNLAAYLRGREPGNPVTHFLARRWLAIDAMRRKSHMNPRTFAVAKDEAGQLDIKPRFRGIMPKQSDQKCPATETWVGPPQDRRSALWTLMGTIGQVAVTEIFPHYFPIEGNAEETGD